MLQAKAVTLSCEKIFLRSHHLLSTFGISTGKPATIDSHDQRYAGAHVD